MLGKHERPYTPHSVYGMGRTPSPAEGEQEGYWAAGQEQGRRPGRNPVSVELLNSLQERFLPTGCLWASHHCSSGPAFPAAHREGHLGFCLGPNLCPGRRALTSLTSLTRSVQHASVPPAAQLTTVRPCQLSPPFLSSLSSKPPPLPCGIPGPCATQALCPLPWTPRPAAQPFRECRALTEG